MTDATNHSSDNDPFSTWPHTWFGFWREFGAAYARCPSIEDFVDESWAHPRRADLVRYLQQAPVVATTSHLAIPWARGQGDGRLSVSWRCDGLWVWFDDLDYYVAEQAVRPPDAFVARIEAMRFTPPSTLEVDVRDLDRPPLG